MSSHTLTTVYMSFCVSLITKLKTVEQMTLFLIAEVRHIRSVTVEQIWYCKETMQTEQRVRSCRVRRGSMRLWLPSRPQILISVGQGCWGEQRLTDEQRTFHVFMLQILIKSVLSGEHRGTIKSFNMSVLGPTSQPCFFFIYPRPKAIFLKKGHVLHALFTKSF